MEVLVKLWIQSSSGGILISSYPWKGSPISPISISSNSMELKLNFRQSPAIICSWLGPKITRPPCSRCTTPPSQVIVKPLPLRLVKRPLSSAPPNQHLSFQIGTHLPALRGSFQDSLDSSTSIIEDDWWSIYDGSVMKRDNPCPRSGEMIPKDINFLQLQERWGGLHTSSPGRHCWQQACHKVNEFLNPPSS